MDFWAASMGFLWYGVCMGLLCGLYGGFMEILSGFYEFLWGFYGDAVGFYEASVGTLWGFYGDSVWGSIGFYGDSLGFQDGAPARTPPPCQLRVSSA